MADLCNLLINSEPARGPMVKGILNVSLPVIAAARGDMGNLDLKRSYFLEDVACELNRGKYDLLPAHEHYWGKEKEA